MSKIKEENDPKNREELFSSVSIAETFAAMDFEAAKFWCGLGRLLLLGYTLKATHDKITAWPPDGATAMKKWDRYLLLRCGWVKDKEISAFETPYAWVSFYPGG